MTADDDVIECATYTHARRHPIVVGQIGGWALPVQLTLTQIAVVAVVYLVEVWTWGLWSRFTPRGLDVLLAVALPVVLAWALRRVRIEGRSVPRALLAWLTLAAMPPQGYVVGRRHRPEPAVDLRSARTYVAPGPGPAPDPLSSAP
ncbi:MAG TPA: TcpE family conjugal transfer membrane protein [Acidimicrobiales bacterium]|nr:TcpE family conjugal transfer membrane protein [Acidimicrobiales bacterium]